LSPAAASFEPTANAASGAFMLPAVTTAPLEFVNVIEPIDDGSGSQPGVTDAASPIPVATQTTGTTSSGATMAAKTTNGVACHLREKTRMTFCRRRCIVRVTPLRSHPEKHSLRTGGQPRQVSDSSRNKYFRERARQTHGR
jgi:hypothetical protein